MRDSAIIDSFNRMEKMVGSDIRLLNKTVATLAMRMDAMQKLVFGGRFSFVWCAILSIFAPKMLERNIDRLHQLMEAQYNRKLEEQMKQAKKAVINPNEVTNPKTVDKMQRSGIGVAVLVVGLLLGGCHNRINLKDVEVLKKDLDSCRTANKVLQTDLHFKEERLRKFNQVNEKGKLKGSNPCYDNPSLPECQEKVDGSETWQK